MNNMGGDVGPESSGGTDGGKQGLGVWGIVGKRWVRNTYKEVPTKSKSKPNHLQCS